jgi:hypothetical protein
MNWDEWESTYKPIQRPETLDDNVWGAMYDSLTDVPHGTSVFNIWTVVDNNPNSTGLDIMNGYHLFNRMGYFVTEVPWSEEVWVTNA